MDISLSIALFITLIVAILLIFKNNTSNEEQKFRKNVEMVHFDNDLILNEEDLKRKLSLLNLSSYEQELLNHLQYEYRISFVPTEHPDIGQSKLGGKPDIVAEFPFDNNLFFLAQIRLKDIKNSLLPPNGMFYFFVDRQQLLKEKSDAVKLYFVDKDADLYTNEATLTFPQLQQSQLILQENISLPEYESAWVQQTFKNYELDAYYKLTNVEKCHKMFGYPNVLSQLFDTQDGNKILLLQLDSDELTGLDWKDFGRMYVFINKEDLQNANFERVYTFFQSYKS